MKYVMLIHQGDTPTPYDPDAWGRLSPEQQQEIVRDYQEISQAAGVTPGLQLAEPDAATTVRVADGATLTTDGPYAGIKEALGGWFVVEADDLDAAIALAARVPAARLGGGVEIRPVLERW